MFQNFDSNRCMVSMAGWEGRQEKAEIEDAQYGLSVTNCDAGCIGAPNIAPNIIVPNSFSVTILHQQPISSILDLCFLLSPLPTCHRNYTPVRIKIPER